MRCQKLLLLLDTDWQVAGDGGVVGSSIAAHIRSCPRCQRGIGRLAEALLATDHLSCSQCRARFPDYYEATHPEYPQVKLSDDKMKEVILHFGRCAGCREEYELFVELAEVEEGGILGE